VPAYETLKNETDIIVQLPENLPKNEIPIERLTKNAWQLSSGREDALLNRLKDISPKLGQVEKVFVGLQTSADSVYIMQLLQEGKDKCKVYSSALSQSIEIESEILKPLLKGAEISRYIEPKHKSVVLFPYYTNSGKATLISENELKSRYPHAYEYLLRNKLRLTNRSKTDESNWWLYPYPKNLSLFGQPKILIQVLGSRGNFSPDFSGKFYFVGGGTAGAYAIQVNMAKKESYLYLLAILNSKLTTYFVSKTASAFRGGYFVFGKSSIANLPIVKGDSYENIVRLVEKMLVLQKERQTVRREDDPDRVRNLERQIAHIDAELDQRVYALYALTEEEIKIVEGNES
jgi:hypothetical protein